ncbi:MAG: ROK family protein [Holdemanella sp.]|nr:ROK family protein [Holdemanella sp.]
MKFLTIDIGGTEFKYAYMNEQYEILERGIMPTFHVGDIDAFEAIVENLYKKYPLDGISLSIPGVIDATKGFVYVSSLGFMNYPIVESLEKKLNTTVYVENDGYSGAIAEATIGSLKDCTNAIFLAVGTGIGGGIILDGKCFKGTRNLAGNASFMIMNSNPVALSGQACSTGGLCNTYAKLKNIDISSVNGKIIMENYRKSEKEACDALQYTCDELAKLIFNMQVLFDPEKIAIGGGISKDALFIERISQSLKELGNECMEATLFPSVVISSKFHNDANLYGAFIGLLDKKKGTA